MWEHKGQTNWLAEEDERCRNHLRKRNSFEYFEVMRPLSLVFEDEGPMAFNIKPTVDIANGQLQDIFEHHGEVLPDSHLWSFALENNDAGKIVLVREYCRAGHEQRSP